MKEDEDKKQIEMHPSGVTMERWRFPFKTAEEQEKIRRWLAVNDLNSDEIKF